MANSIRLPRETAALLEKVFDLLGALKQEYAPFAEALEAGAAARLMFDTKERVLVVSVVDEQGHGHPIAAIAADPFDRGGGFGLVGTPEPVVGLYEPPAQTH
jgi:hypothetical protein